MSAVMQARRPRPIPPPAPPRRWWRSTGLALLAWACLVGLTHVWGERLVHRDPRVRIFAAPLAGRLDPRLGGWRVLPAIAVAAVAVSLGPRLARQLPMRRLLLAGFGLAAAWAVALAAVDGLHALVAPLTTRWDYLIDVRKVGGVHGFLSAFVANLGRYATHVRAHPPGFLLLLRGLAAIGLRGPVPEAVLVVAGGAAAVPAAMLALREVAGERAARSAWPFLALAPAALWVATSADAFFAGVAAWGVALVVISTGPDRRRMTALAGGILLGAAALLSYGLVLVWLVPAAVCLWRRRIEPLTFALLGAVAVILACAALGFWWPAGLAATRAQYLHGAARLRPQGYFWIGNLGAFALVIGPACAVALGRLRRREAWLLAGGALLAVALADASGFSKGEVERIWLPFAPWVLTATAAFGRPAAARRWLAVQAAAALGMQLVVRSPW